jgi:hypothetical protein
MAIVNNLTNESEAMPMKDETIIICPVEETGKNSVIPSTIAKTIACQISIKINYFLGE